MLRGGQSGRAVGDDGSDDHAFGQLEALDGRLDDLTAGFGHQFDHLQIGVRDRAVVQHAILMNDALNDLGSGQTRGDIGVHPCLGGQGQDVRAPDRGNGLAHAEGLGDHAGGQVAGVVRVGRDEHAGGGHLDASEQLHLGARAGFHLEMVTLMEMIPQELRLFLG